MHRMRSDFLIILFGRIFQAVFLLVSLRISTEYLGAAEIGRKNIILSLGLFFSLLLISPVANYIARESIEWYQKDLLVKKFLGFTFFLCGVAFFSSVVLFFYHFAFGIGIAINIIWLLLFMVANLIFNSLNTVLTTVLNTLGYRIWFVILINLTSWSGVGIAVWLSTLRGYKAEYWMEGILIGQIITTIIAFYVLFKLVPSKKEELKNHHEYWTIDFKSVFIFSWPLIMSTGLYWIQTDGYRLIIARFTGEATIGLLTTGLSLAAVPLAMVDTVFTEYYRPIYYQQIAFGDNNHKANAWNQYASAYFPIVIISSVVIAFSGPFLARVLLSSEFQQIGWLSFWGALAKAAFMIYGVYVSLSFSIMDTKPLIVPNLLGAVVVLLIIVFWGRTNIMLVTGIALFMGMTMTAVLSGLILRKRMSIILPWRRMIIALVAVFPLAIFLQVLQVIFPSPSLKQSVVILSVFGVVVLVILIVLSKNLIYKEKSSGATYISET